MMLCGWGGGCAGSVLGKAGHGNGGGDSKGEKSCNSCGWVENKPSEQVSLAVFSKSEIKGIQNYVSAATCQSLLLRRGCCDNPSGMGNGASINLVYFFSVEFTSECFQRMIELFCGAFDDGSHGGVCEDKGRRCLDVC